MKDMGLARLAVAGTLVGFGTQLGNGCTSGHGMTMAPIHFARPSSLCPRAPLIARNPLRRYLRYSEAEPTLPPCDPGLHGGRQRHRHAH